MERPMVHIKSNLLLSEELRHGFHWIAAQWIAESPWSVRGTSVLCLWNVRALSVKRPCPVRRSFVLCPQIVCALSAERQCSVHAVHASVYYVSVYPQSEWLAKSPIAVARMLSFPKSLIVGTVPAIPKTQFLVDCKCCENHHQGQKWSRLDNCTIIKQFVKLTKLRGFDWCSDSIKEKETFDNVI